MQSFEIQWVEFFKIALNFHEIYIFFRNFGL